MLTPYFLTVERFFTFADILSLFVLRLDFAIWLIDIVVRNKMMPQNLVDFIPFMALRAPTKLIDFLYCIDYK